MDGSLITDRVLSLADTVMETGAPLASVALAWLKEKGPVTAPIASATSVAQLDELLGGVRLALDPAAVARLDEASRGSLKS